MKRKQNQKVLKELMAVEDRFRRNKRRIDNLKSYLKRNKEKISQKEVSGKISFIQSLENENTILLREIKKLELQV